ARAPSFSFVGETGTRAALGAARAGSDGSEVDLDAAVEGAADIGVDRAARARAGEAEGRLHVGQIVDAEIEAEAVVDLRFEPQFVIEFLRVARRRGGIRILRRIALHAVRRLVAEDRHRSDVAE